MFHFSSEVQEAIANKRPIVALESTIISHGMPFPENLKSAQEVSAIIREHGATPATIALIKGAIHIGVTDEELHFIGSEKMQKLSRSDLPIALAKKQSGATTVSATMILANLAKIPVFATGGIGGVHRGAEESWDVSADLYELAETDVAVVASGAKSILDIPKTLELLESLGVPVLGYQTEEFPSFYTRTSGCRVNAKVDSPAEIAKIIHAKGQLGLKGGILIANPIPKEEALESQLVEAWIRDALKEAQVKKISGKEITPFLLAQITKRSEGKSLKANQALIKNNAKLAALLAVALNKL